MANTGTESGPQHDRQLSVGYYVVCILDILGQTEKLKGWAKLPAEGMPSAEFIGALKKTVGTVVGLRGMFEDYFNQFSQTPLSENHMACLTVEQRRTFERTRDTVIYTQQFGDTFLFYSPLVNNHGDITMRPMYCMLTACGMIMTVGLAGKVPLRGTLSVGVGTEIDAGIFYGPVLPEVHHIESRIACYPRIVVSDQAVEFAKGDFRFSANPPIEPNRVIEQLNQEVGNVCRALMHKDADGRIIVDFLGAQMRVLDNSAGNTLPIIKAYQFVRSEARRFTDSGDEKLAELADRYQRLLDYMESRLPQWGLSPEGIRYGG